MANIRKSFNFRSGLQVDNDNFVVNETGNVGIGTSTPQEYLLNVYGDKALRVTGLTTTGRLYAGIGTVGILSATDANISGVVTVGQLKVGSSEVVDNLIGYARTTFITDNAGVGLHTTSKLGINTTTSPGASDVEFKVHGNADVTGVLTATTFSGSLPVTDLDGTLTNAQLPTNIDKPTGIITASSFVGTATAASSLTGTTNITVGTVTATKLIANVIEVPNTGITTITKLLHVGTGGTVFSALEAGRVGVGTALPTSDLQIRKSSGTLVEVVSDSGEARISIGQSVGVGKSTGVLRFGNSTNDFDIINNDKEGDINFILSGLGQTAEGKFSWQDGETFTEVMSLHPNGNFSVLGITTLASGGSITTTGGALYVGGNLNVKGSITGTLTLPNLITSNINTNSGVTTLTSIDIVANAVPNAFSGILVAAGSSIGIGTSTPRSSLDAFEVSSIFGSVGINTTGVSTEASLLVNGATIITDAIGVGTITGIPINGGPGLEIHKGFFDLYDTRVSITSPNTSTTIVIDNKTSVGIGSTQPQAAIDLSGAGKGGNTQYAYMVLPKVTNSEITGFTDAIAGAIVFNTDTNKFQGYNGTTWDNLN